MLCRRLRHALLRASSFFLMLVSGAQLAAAQDTGIDTYSLYIDPYLNAAAAGPDFEGVPPEYLDCYDYTTGRWLYEYCGPRPDGAPPYLPGLEPPPTPPPCIS